jgi:enterochelin esterase family protein
MRLLGAVALFALAAGSLAAEAPQPAVESLLIDDTTYGRQRRVWVYESPGAQEHHLFIFLGGETYVDELAAPATLQTLVASGQVPPAIAVMVDTSSERPAELANRAKFDRFVTADLLPWLRARLGGRLPEAKKVVVAGFSVGGVTAAYLAFRHPELFGNVLAQSGAFWRGNEGASEPAEWLTGQLRDKPRLPLRFYVEVGAEEVGRTPAGVVFIEANRRLRDVLAAKGYAYRYTEVPNARHDVAHWRSALPAGILYLSR